MKQVHVSGKALLHIEVPFDKNLYLNDNVTCDKKYIAEHITEIFHRYDVAKFLFSSEALDADFYDQISTFIQNDDIFLNDVQENGHIMGHGIYDED